ncbi:hypothetical protein C3L33_12942, partial [Rhododendron williamsianum]
MGAITYDMEIPSSIPAPRMFKAFVLDADTLIPRSFHRPSRAWRSLKVMEESELFLPHQDRSHPDGGSICKNRSIYHTKGDAQVTEEEIKAGKEKALGMFKAVEAYLLANPDA